MTPQANAVSIAHDDQGSRGRYVAQVADAAQTGHLDWELRSPGVRTATHTIVPPEIGGRGIAGELVEALVADARAQNFRIEPQCSYVQALFDKTPEWADLRA